VKILYQYLFQQVATACFSAIAVLTSVLLLGDAFKRIFNLLLNNDIPLPMILQMFLLLIPQAATLTIPWGMLVGILLVFGRMSHDHEIQIVRSAGLGLIPFIAPVVLMSLMLSVVCFYNNAILAPRCMTAFKFMLVDMGRNNPTVLIRAQEPITKFPGIKLYVDKKSGNTIEGISIWELDKQGYPHLNVRADRGIMTADLQDMKLTLMLFNTRQEERGADATDLSKIQTGMKASQLPVQVSLGDLMDTSQILEKESNMTLPQIGSKIFSGKVPNINFTPLLTEMQKRLAFSFACFSFTLVGIPLAISTGRKETSIGFVISMGVVVVYYLMIVVAMSFKQYASAFPELLVWIPNLLMQGLGVWLLWRVNRHPL